MSDTPRSDGKLSQCHDAAKAMDWARELEREVSALRAENERLREALRPFADQFGAHRTASSAD